MTTGGHTEMSTAKTHDNQISLYEYVIKWLQDELEEPRDLDKSALNTPDELQRMVRMAIDAYEEGAR